MKFQPVNKIAKRIVLPLVILSLTIVLPACHEEDEIDFRAPTLTINSPIPGSNVSSTNVTISGTISSDVVLVEISLLDDMDNVIGTPVTEIPVGTTFTSAALTLVAGDNKINVMARDAIGNRNSITFNLHYAQLNIGDDTADVVIGQADFTSNVANRGSTEAANSLSGVQGSLHEKSATTLYIPDTGNNRILGFNAIPATDGVDANFVLGQANLTSSSAGVSATELTGPSGIYTTSTKLFIADTGNNRVLIWNSHPTNNTVAAAHVVGQIDMTSATPGCSNSMLSAPATVMVVDDPDTEFVIEEKVIVLDKGNNRVLIWNSIPDADGVAADVVVGQTDDNSMAMTVCQPNDDNGDGVTDSVSARTLNNPGGLWTDGQRLVVADTGNNRVLVWDTFPTTNGEPASWVIGQADKTSSAAAGLNAPMSVTSNQVQLFIADTGNTRVLIHDNFPTADNETEDAVIGPGYSYDLPAPGMTSFSSVNNIYVDRTRLFIVDDNRVLIFNSL